MAALIQSQCYLKKLILVLVTGLLLLTASLVQANKLGIWPIDPVVKFDEKNSKIQVRNLDLSHPVRIQVKVQRWEQIDNKDRLSDQNDIAISPPQIEIAPGVEQLFRIIVKNKNPELAGDATYRILVDVVPTDVVTNKTTSGLNLAMRYSLPLYVHMQPNNPKSREHISQVESALSYRLTPPNKMTIINNSVWSQRISRVDIQDDRKKTSGTITEGLLGYVLPNSHRTFEIPPEAYQTLKQSPYFIVYHYNDKEYRIAPQQ